MCSFLANTTGNTLGELYLHDTCVSVVFQPDKCGMMKVTWHRLTKSCTRVSVWRYEAIVYCWKISSRPRYPFIPPLQSSTSKGTWISVFLSCTARWRPWRKSCCEFSLLALDLPHKVIVNFSWCDRLPFKSHRWELVSVHRQLQCRHRSPPLQAVVWTTYLTLAVVLACPQEPTVPQKQWVVVNFFNHPQKRHND